MIRFLLVFIEPILLGCLATAALLADPRDGELALALAPGVGFGLFSLAFFFWRISGLPVMGLAAAEGFVFLLALGCCRWRKRSSFPGFFPASRDSGRFRVAFWTLAVFSCLVLLVRTFRGPYGDSDAWCIWNLHARFLFRGGARWGDYLTQRLAWGHPDYPLLLPGLVSGEEALLGRETPWISVGVALAYALSVPALLACVFRRMRAPEKGRLAALVLLGTSTYLYQASSQLADVPLAFYFLGAVASLFLADDAAPGFFVLAGLCAGMAAWTKNEGILFLLVIVAALAARPGGFRRGFAFGAGAAPSLAALLFFKWRFAPANDLVAGQTFHLMAAKALDGSRWLMILGEFAKVAAVGGRSGLDMSPLLLGLYAAWTGFEAEIPRREALKAAGWIVAGMGLGYFVVYLLTPQPLEWHLATSLARLFIQLWPCMIFLTFAWTQEPASVPS